MDVSRKIVYRVSSTWNPVADYRYDGAVVSMSAYGRRAVDRIGASG